MSTSKQLLKTNATEDGRIIVESQNMFMHGFILVGCSEMTNVPSGSHTPSLVIFPQLEEGQEGLAVIRYPKQSKITFEASWPLRISIREGTPRVHLAHSVVGDESYWVCSRERIGGVVESHLEVNLNGTWYRSDVAVGGKGCIPDPDLMCRYLVGKVSKEDLLAVVVETKKEETAQQKLVELQDAYAELERQCRILQHRISGFTDMIT